jgi:hypothetical protein
LEFSAARAETPADPLWGRVHVKEAPRLAADRWTASGNCRLACVTDAQRMPVHRHLYTSKTPTPANTRTEARPEAIQGDAERCDADRVAVGVAVAGGAADADASPAA